MKETPILFNADMVRALLDGRKTQTRRLVKPQPHGEVPSSILPGWYEPLRVGRDGIEYPGSPVYGFASEYQGWPSPFGAPGDRLWVRETCCIAPKRFAAPDDSCVIDTDGDPRHISYKADGHPEDAMREYGLKWRPSIHMPRWACRLTLDVTAVRVERLQDISEDDAKAEGVLPIDMTGCDAEERELLDLSLMEDDAPYRNGFATLWDSIYGKPSPVYERDSNGKLIITNYESYPWSGESGTFEHNGKPHIVVANPWVWVGEFEKQECC